MPRYADKQILQHSAYLSTMKLIIVNSNPKPSNRLIPTELKLSKNLKH